MCGDERRLAEVHIAAWQAGYAGLMPADFLAGLSMEVGTEHWRRSLTEPTPGVTNLVAALDGNDEPGDVGGVGDRHLVGIATIGPSRGRLATGHAVGAEGQCDRPTLLRTPRLVSGRLRQGRRATRLHTARAEVRPHTPAWRRKPACDVTAAL
jgi:hypothetical protein